MNIRSILGFGLYCAFRLFWKKPQFLSIYFHNPTPKAFEEIVKWVSHQGYDIVEVNKLVDYMKGDVTDGKYYCVITFDDAWQSNLKLIPVVEKYNIPITIFAPVMPLIEGNYWWRYAQKVGGIKMSNELKCLPEERFNEAVKDLKKEVAIEREAMTMEELKSVSKHPLVNIQSHSYTHPILTNVSGETLDYELRESKLFLEKELDKKINAFCYPNGSVSEREIKKASELYDYAFSVIQDTPRVKGDLYTIPRCALTDDYWSNLAKIIGAWNRIKK